MKKILSGVLILFVLILGFYFFYPVHKKSSTTSEFTISSKQIEQKQFWIDGYNPNSSKKENLHILVKDKNAWNRLDKNKTYILTYTTDDNKMELQEIVSTE